MLILRKRCFCVAAIALGIALSATSYAGSDQAPKASTPLGPKLLNAPSTNSIHPKAAQRRYYGCFGGLCGPCGLLGIGAIGAWCVVIAVRDRAKARTAKPCHYQLPSDARGKYWE